MSLSAVRCVFQTVFPGKLVCSSSMNVFSFSTLQCPKIQLKYFQTNSATVTRKTSMPFFSKRHVHVAGVLKRSKNYYDVLGVSRNANQKQIKDAYYKLAMKYHPDKNQGKLTQQFREIKEAYDVLSNESSRMEYNSSSNNNTSTFNNWSSNNSYERYKSPPYEEYRQAYNQNAYKQRNWKYSSNNYDYLRPYNVFINVIKVPKNVVKIQFDILLITLIKNRILKMILLQIFQFMWSHILNNLNFNVLISSTTQTNSLIEFVKNLLTHETVRIELTEMEAIRGKAIRVQINENEKVLVVDIPGGVKKNQSFYLFYLNNDDNNSTRFNKN